MFCSLNLSLTHDAEACFVEQNRRYYRLSLCQQYKVSVLVFIYSVIYTPFPLAHKAVDGKCVCVCVGGVDEEFNLKQGRDQISK